MDPRSHRVANALVGNHPGAAALEVTLSGPDLEFDDERLVAVCGAEFALESGGRPQPMDAPFVVPAGSRVRFGSRGRGTRAYLAVSGGIDVQPVLGSRSTHVPTRMGGLAGRPLRAGDRLPLGSSPRLLRVGTSGASMAWSRADEDVCLRVVAGPQHDRFVDDALGVLESEAYVVRADSDRMGFRLEGRPIGHRGSADLISDATPLGALQVPGSGQPVLLMADRQTTGGYPKIATVIAADMCLAGQLAPGNRVRFRVCTVQDALAALIRQERALMSLEAVR
jgi:antagonist of KipI